MPEVGLRTTFIVGYPGKTEREFEQLLRFVEEQRFDHVGAFAYSPQPSTPAAEAGERVPGAVVEERYGRLMELAQGLSHAAIAPGR